MRSKAYPPVHISQDTGTQKSSAAFRRVGEVLWAAR